MDNKTFLILIPFVKNKTDLIFNLVKRSEKYN